jgi:hypothetical protein
MMDNPGNINLNEIVRAINSADVMVFRFSIIEKRLLFDARANAEEGPLLKLVPRVNSAQERFRSLRELRPAFPLPENIIAFSWGKFISSLKTDGIWDVVEERARRSGFPNTDEMCRRVFLELLEMENDERIAALTGKGYRTLWQRSPSA